MVIGNWSLVIGHRSLVIGHWSLVISRYLKRIILPLTKGVSIAFSLVFAPILNLILGPMICGRCFWINYYNYSTFKIAYDSKWHIAKKHNNLLQLGPSTEPLKWRKAFYFCFGYSLGALSLICFYLLLIDKLRGCLEMPSAHKSISILTLSGEH